MHAHDLGLATARVLDYDEAEARAGIYGFNAAPVGIAAFIFFRPRAACVALMAGGCVASAIVTRLIRRFLPFPTYTSPFILTPRAPRHPQEGPSP